MTPLIEQLERTDGPKFALDCAIYETTLPGEWFGSKVESWFGRDTGVWGCNTADGWRHLDCLRTPAFTASIDAALRLVPTGWVRSVDATVPEMGTDVELYPPVGLGGVVGRHKHESIATCIAALLAREQVARG